MSVSVFQHWDRAHNTLFPRDKTLCGRAELGGCLLLDDVERTSLRDPLNLGIMAS